MKTESLRYLTNRGAALTELAFSLAFLAVVSSFGSTKLLPYLSAYERQLRVVDALQLSQETRVIAGYFGSGGGISFDQAIAQEALDSLIHTIETNTDGERAAGFLFEVGYTPSAGSCVAAVTPRVASSGAVATSPRVELTDAIADLAERSCDPAKKYFAGTQFVDPALKRFVSVSGVRAIPSEPVPPPPQVSPPPYFGPPPPPPTIVWREGVDGDPTDVAQRYRRSLDSLDGSGPPQHGRSPSSPGSVDG